MNNYYYESLKGKKRTRQHFKAETDHKAKEKLKRDSNGYVLYKEESPGKWLQIARKR